MSNKGFLFLVVLMYAIDVFGQNRVSMGNMRNADESLMQLSQIAYLQGDYMKCIKYAENIHDAFYGYWIELSLDTCRTNAMVHAYAAAACYMLSKYDQQSGKSNFYGESSSYDYLFKATKHYLKAELYVKEQLLKKEININTHFNELLEYATELDIVMQGNLAAQEYMKISAYSERSWNREVFKLNKIYQKLSKCLKDKVFANKNILKADLPTYNAVQTTEILYMLFKNKKSRKKAMSLIDEYFSDLLQVVSSLGSVNDNKSAYVMIGNNARRLSQAVCIMAHENIIEWETAVDIYLSYLNFYEYITGIRNNFELISWRQIKNSLMQGEYLFVFYEGPVASGELYHVSQSNMNHFYAFVIGWDKETVEILCRKLNIVITEEDFSRWQVWWPQMECAYILGTGFMKTIDCAGINDKIYMIHSVKSLEDRTSYNTLSYNIKYVGNLYYSEDSEINGTDTASRGIGYEPLEGCKMQIDYLDSMRIRKRIDNLQVLEKMNGMKSLILRKGNENILHIATHGEMDQCKLNELNLAFPLDGYTGDNILRSCYLSLSAFNDYPINDLPSYKGNETILSGYDIASHDFSNLELVYIDGCKTAYSKTVNGEAFSLAEAFYKAGAKHIIAYLTPVLDVVAVKFSKLFYQNLFEGQSIHDSFYSAKRAIQDIEPGLQIVLWE